MTIVRNVIEYLQILYDFPASQAAVIMAVTAFLYFLGCAAVPGLKKKMTKAGAVSGLLLSFYISRRRTDTKEANIPSVPAKNIQGF